MWKAGCRRLPGKIANRVRRDTALRSFVRTSKCSAVVATAVVVAAATKAVVDTAAAVAATKAVAVAATKAVAAAVATKAVVAAATEAPKRVVASPVVISEAEGDPKTPVRVVASDPSPKTTTFRSDSSSTEPVRRAPSAFNRSRYLDTAG